MCEYCRVLLATRRVHSPDSSHPRRHFSPDRVTAIEADMVRLMENIDKGEYIMRANVLDV